MPQRHLNLRNANLRRAKFENANLNGADLCGANLEWADFRWADLIGANLSKAKTDRADFYKADLKNAILKEASLLDTNFEDANLQRADFSNAIFSQTRLINSDLRGSKGLDSINHIGPSVIESETLVKAGYLPSTFLRGCGLSDAAIKAAHAEEADPINEELIKGGEFFSCFISYSSNDSAFAIQLHKDLQANGVRCWFDKKNIKIGDKILDTIFAEIRKHEKLLLVLSKYSVESGWVEDEVVQTFEEERDRKEPVIFPITLDDAVLKSAKSWARKIRSNRHIGDFTRWKNRKGYQAATNRLMNDLKKP
jgi:uncharacterized protein YjbI with pentapeptide repeats